MLGQSNFYNNDSSERVFLCGRMSQNIRGGKKSKAGEKGDGRCYCPCKKCCFARPVRILISIATKHCRNYGHIDRRSNEYRPMVISYIFIICFMLSVLYKIIYMYILFEYLL
jgi:hypothetical protein